MTSISHDLRTPLASIIGAVSSLRSFPEKYGAAEREELLATLQDEAERLNRFVSNLLDMTRLESGAIELKLDLIDVGEIIGAALQRAASVLARHRVEVAVAPELPMLRLDAVLFEQVLFNLLDNAAKYSPPGSRIDIRASRDGELVEIEVVDEGSGHPAQRPRTHLRQILPRPGAGPPPRRHRARPRDLPRLCRGAWAAGSSPATAATARARY